MNLLWNCLNVASDVCRIIESTEYEENPNTDLAELKGTIHSIRATAVPFLKKANHDPAFDVCINGIKESLEACKALLRQAAEEGSGTLELELKIQIYRIDFSINQKLDQFTSLYPSLTTTTTSSSISDTQGRALWKASFGEQTLMVPWASFFQVLENFTSNPLKEHELILRTFLDFTNDGLVSIFEFSTFLKWFGPLNGCVERLLQPISSGILAPFIPACEANKMLHEKQEGSFLIRFSKSHLNSFALTFVDSQRQIKHCLLYCAHPSGVTLKNPPKIYPSLTQFVAAHSNKLKVAMGKQTNFKYELLQHVHAQAERLDSESRVNNKTNSNNNGTGDSSILHRDEDQLKAAQQDVCVVCMDKEINSVFLECAHLACCKTCALQVQKCPVCRAPISRVIQVFRIH